MEFSKTIFIVDDDEDDRLLMSDAINTFVEGINVVEAASGIELFNILATSKSAEDARVILIDMNMPRMNGLELLTLLKEDARWRAIPVIMLSTTSNPALVNKAYDLGVNAFLVKPIVQTDFEWMSQMINFCFVSNFAKIKLPAPKTRLTWKNVLVVEDNDDHWELMKFSLKQSLPNLKLERAFSKSTLLELMQKYQRSFQKPEIILLDLYMPDRQDGLNLLRDIREFTAKNMLPNIPVIVFSYSDYPQDVRAAMSERANAYLVKPPDVDLWPAYLQNLLHVWSNAASLPKVI